MAQTLNSPGIPVGGVLSALNRSLDERVRAWAEKSGVTLPNLPAPAEAPAHIKADISLSWPMALAKAAKKSPLEIAGQLAEAFAGIPGLETAEVSKPGFVNLTFKRSTLTENLTAIIKDPDRYGRGLEGAPRSILIEFVSANPTGPLHMASGRGATLGDSLVKILRRLGHKVHAEYYINDAGVQTRKLGLSLKARREGKEPPENGYLGDYVTELAKSFPPEADGWPAEKFQKEGIDALLKGQQEDMAGFGVTFDRWYRESELHAAGAVPKTLEILKSRNMVYEKEGATWLATTETEGSKDDKDRVLIKADGAPTYFLPDIAYHEDKYSRGFSELINIFGSDHHGYVPRMTAALVALGHPAGSFHVIVHQLVHLFRGKQAVKMSKRAGEFVRLKEIVDEVGRDACRFFFAMRTPDSHLNFDLELAKKKTSENPVYYCQYVHARIVSIFSEALKQKVITDGEALLPRPELLKEPQERALLLKLAWFHQALRECEKLLSPHPLANYILELAGLYHPFYEHCRVVDPGALDLSRSRLALCSGVKSAISEGLGLLGVSAPERM